jgi:uncharacterized protein with NRDE domain
MCLILFAWHSHPDYPLILAGNRDEFYARPTAPAGFWDDHPQILAGRDLEQGGTWLGIHRSGRLAAVTNYRDGRAARRGTRSRGELVSGFLTSDLASEEYLQQVHRQRTAYDGFNLLIGTPDGLFSYSSRSEQLTEVEPGVHGLSNHLLDSPWPKVERGKAALRELRDSNPEALIERLLAVLADRAPAPDHALPDTGIDLVRERVLSPAFIATPNYGTRCSTILLLDTTGQVSFTERTHPTDHDAEQTRRYAFTTTLPIIG